MSARRPTFSIAAVTGERLAQSGTGKARLHAFVHGKVQGVYFRDSTLEEARARNLTGWVKNLSDRRTVEVLAEGPRPELEELLAWLHKGPPLAIVEEVDVEWGDAKGDLRRFAIVG